MVIGNLASLLSGGSPPKIKPRKRRPKHDRSCAHCFTTNTPIWRRGPDGSLCNACGLVYIRQQRKSARQQVLATREPTASSNLALISIANLLNPD